MGYSVMRYPEKLSSRQIVADAVLFSDQTVSQPVEHGAHVNWFALIPREVSPIRDSQEEMESQSSYDQG